MKRAPLGLICAVALLSAACGGGGSTTGSTGSTPAPVAAPPAGASPSPAPSAANWVNEASCGFQYTLPFTSPSTLGVDPLLSSQWHLVNTGQSGGIAGNDLNVASAWNTTRGSGIRVAVVDDAIDVSHPDLLPNVVSGMSYNYRTGANLGNAFPLPCSNADEHGTAVAGLIAARDGNAVGVSGVASRASLVGFNALATSTSADIADALLRDNQNVAVYNNSWGSPDDGKLHAPNALFDTAITQGLSTGRSGRGSIYVFSAGNGGCYQGNVTAQSTCDGWSDNANFDGFTNRLGVIATCAVSDRGTRPWYDETGANVLVCGTSSNLTSNITTTDITKRAGGNGYRNDFSGTSATAPMVSGVIALMLAARPDLTWRDVKLILAETARKNDPTNTGWLTSNAGKTETANKFYNYHPSYAFGTVDAQAALARAVTWTTVGGSSSLRSCGPYTRTPNLTVQDATATAGGSNPGATTEDSLAVAPADCPISKIEFVEISFTATFDRTPVGSGDLEIRLVSPNSLVSTLANSRACTSSCGDYTDWKFGSVRHLGEAVAGTWRLQVTDRLPVDIATVRSWSLRFYGR